MPEPEEPERVTTGRDPTVGVGNFTCACGNVIADSDSDDDAIELTPIPDERVLPDDDSIHCEECDRIWRLVDDGEHWEVLEDDE